MRGARWLAVPVLSALVLGSVIEAEAKTTVSAFAAPAELESRADALTVLVRSFFASKATANDHRVSATLRSIGPDLAVTVRVMDASGKEVGTDTVRGTRGDLVELATKVSKRAAKLAGTWINPRRPLVSFGQLRPFGKADRLLGKGQAEAAFTALAAARRPIAARASDARRIAIAIAGNATLTLEQRAVAAIAGADATGLARLAEAALAKNKRDPVAQAAQAWILLSRGDAKKAERALRRAKRSRNPFVQLVVAEVAHRRERRRDRDRALSRLLEASPYVPALAFVADLPPGALGKKLERAVLRGANRIRPRYPGLAAALGLRAARGGIDPDRALALVDVAELDQTELTHAESLASDAAKRRKAVGLRLQGELLMRKGEHAAARKAIDAALEIDQDDTQSKKHQASLLQLEDDESKDPDTSGPDADKAATDAKLEGAKPLTNTSLQDLAGALEELLDAFPQLSEQQLSTVLLAPLPGSKEAFYYPYQVDPDRLAAGLEIALRRYRVSPSQIKTTTKASTGLIEVARAHEVQAVLLYGLRAAGSRAKVRLVLFEASTSRAKELTDTIDGKGLGLVGWNNGFLGILITLGGLLVGYVAFRLVRATSSVVVTLKNDPAAEEQALVILLSRSDKTPQITDLEGHASKLKKGGFSRSKYEAHMVGKTTRFDKIPVGRWYVHVYGTFVKAGTRRALPADTREEIKVGRGQPAHTTFDLVPKHAEYRVRVFDGERPLPKIEVWIDDKRDHAEKTSKSGEATVLVPRGEHVIRMFAKEMQIERPVVVADTKSRVITVNLERERRMQATRHGIAIDLNDAGSDVEIVDSSGQRVDRKQKSAAATEALPGGTPAIAAMPAAGTSAPAPSATTGLDRYKPITELGRGAMGVVYKAKDQVLERDVALKVMSEEVRQYPDALRMFLQEAKALAALNHPNIVTVFDQGTHNGQTFMVMEFVEGTTLEDLLEKHERLDVRRTVGLADQICAGLAYAHGKRVIHRDIKPANIFIASDGTVKLGDFGLARVVNEMRIRKTAVRGTPLYMSPEQIHGEDIDFRSDLYSVGCTLFEVATGRPPFVDGEILYHHVHTEPQKPSELVEGIPPTLDAIIMAMIAKDKDQRFRSADAVRDALKRVEY